MYSTSYPKDQQHEPSLSMVEAAVEWRLKLESQTASQQDLTEFKTWRESNPAHNLACERLDQALGKVKGIDAKLGIKTLESLKATSKRNNYKTGIFSFLLAIGFYSSITSEMAGYWLSDYSSKVGEQRVIQLDDNSKITLNTNSAINVEYKDSIRLITLKKGEIFVEVAKDAHRPFIVATTHGTAKALGTKFVVKKESDSTMVGVVESVVEACSAKSFFKADKPTCVRLNADSVTHLFKDIAPIKAQVYGDYLAAWTSGTLAVDNEPLANVLDELSRYREGKILYNADEIANFKVSGVIPLKDSEQALKTLAGRLPIQYKNYSPYILYVEPIP